MYPNLCMRYAVGVTQHIASESQVLFSP